MYWRLDLKFNKEQINLRRFKMKAVFNVYADPRNKAYSKYLFTLREVLEAIKLGKDFHTNIMY